MTQDRLITCLWFERGEGRKFAEFFTALFPDSRIDHGSDAPSDFPGGKAGDPLTIEFTLLGRPFVALDGGPEFKPTMAVSQMVITESQQETDRYWGAITSHGGSPSECGWCSDRWGYSWQITPRILLEGTTHADPAVAKRVFDAMMTMGKIDHARIEAAIAGDITEAG